MRVLLSILILVCFTGVSEAKREKKNPAKREKKNSAKREKKNPVKKQDVHAGLKKQLDQINPAALGRLQAYLKATHPQYHKTVAAAFDELRKTDVAGLQKKVEAQDPAALKQAYRLVEEHRRVLVNNPEINFDDILLIKRKPQGKKYDIALPANWQSNSSVKKNGWDNEIARMSIKGEPALKTVYRPAEEGCVTDIDLHFSAQKMLISMPGKNKRWQLHEISIDGKYLGELPLIPDEDVENYDACYLPDGKIIFTSTAPMIGVPCVKGSSHVTNSYLYDPKTGTVRRLTFDQEHNWCPTVLNNGQILYLRWEYSDIPHFVARILFTMNQDGTNQRALYGSNSYWPNGIFYARPIPGHPSKIVGIVSGHHGVRRMGQLVVFDPQQGQFEADGVVQAIPGYGKKVEPIILDRLVDKLWPRFLHPFPISENFFLVSAQMGKTGNWGIYLVDTFDNMLLLKEEPDYALLEPVPVLKRTPPPVIPSKIDPGSKTAIMSIVDIYQGDGLKDVPRGTVKQLRLVTYQFAYHGMGGQVNRVGLDGPWDIKQVLGTVPVEPDGSAMFEVPANTPISIQPLDADGKAIALMRSWTTAMPGEVLSCVGCHESMNTAPPVTSRMANSKPPSKIKPWYGPARGFSFKREVQPVLDQYCVGCHDGKKTDRPDFTLRPEVQADCKSKNYQTGSMFSPSYIALRSYVRSPTIESDMHLLPPYEFHADTTELVQLLNQGHHGVQLSAEAEDRLYTWIDLHAPYHGTWTELVGTTLVNQQRERRLDLMAKYSTRSDDEEYIFAAAPPKVEFQKPPKTKNKKSAPKGFKIEPLSGNAAKEVASIALVRIPGGKFINTEGKSVKIDQPFWMGKFEVTNEEFAQFDPKHDSRLEHGDFLQFSIQERGYPLNAPDQPVCRVTQQQAEAYCKWLGEKTGKTVRLPTRDQWEWACRAGTATPHWYGAAGTNFSAYANLADANLARMDTFGWKLPSGAVPEWKPAIRSQDDKFKVSAPVGSYKPNPWGLYDMHGNVAEWTDNALACGGSWWDRPKRATSDFAIPYKPWQPVYNVGFRIVVEN